MGEINQKEYLKKYLGIGRKSGEKKKKKKSKQTSNGLKIVDDDVDISLIEEIKVDLTADNEEAPQIVSIIDDRPPSLRIDEATGTSLWKPIGAPEVSSSADRSLKFEGSLKIMKSSSSDSKYQTLKKIACKADFALPRKRDNVTQRDSSVERKIKKEPEGEMSPPRKSRQSDSDSSPPRRGKNEKSLVKRSRDNDLDTSPIRKIKREISEDISPPRKSQRRDSVDISPTRKSKRTDSEDNSPPRKTKRSADNTPPRRAQNVPDTSPIRKIKREISEDISPPRKSRKRDSVDISPPRKSKRADSEDNSPPRKTKRSADNTPPRAQSVPDTSRIRKIKREKSEDISPPRKSQRRDSVDISPPRKSKRTDSEDNSHPKKSKRSADTSAPRRAQKRSRWGNAEEPEEKSSKTLDGKKAGLQNALDLVQEMHELKKKEDELFKNMRKDISGANAATVVRGKKKEVNWEEEEVRRKKEEENVEKYNKWGKGLKQVEDVNEKIKNEAYEMSKPLARYADDEDLEKYLKDQEREGDPMLAYLRKKKKKKAVDEGKPVAQQYEGDAPLNRFGIRPGYRWDGVDRSSGYEKQWFQVQNSQKANIEESYKWSTEDM